MLGTITVVLVVVLAVLVVFFLRTRRKDQIAEMLEKRRGTSKLVSSAGYVEGLETMPVALALTANEFYYENPDLQASFDLNRIDEVEYDGELSTGRPVDAGNRVLRLRSHGTTFEFVMPQAEMAKWQAALPPRRMDQPTARVG